jgi:hypothetical protein
MRLLRHYSIEVPTVRHLDLELSRRHEALLAEVLRCSPHLLRNMTQSRGGRVRSALVAIGHPTQICRTCALRHNADSVTRGARLRSWMEGWRITCPICGAALGSKLRARSSAAQQGEVAIAVETLNRMIRVAKPLSVRVR